MAEETQTPEQKAQKMLENAMGLIAVETGLITEFVTKPMAQFRKPNDEEAKQIEEARVKRAEAAEAQAKEEK
jgi:hypothetical protein